MKKNPSAPSGFSSPRILLALILCAAGLFLALNGFDPYPGASVLAQSPGKNSLFVAKVAPQVLVDTADGGMASVVILLADQADVSAAYGIKDQDVRGWFVYNTLTQHAAITQGGLRAFLEARGVSYQSFWAANMIIATGDRSLVESIAARSDVARVESNNPSRWIEVPEVASAGLSLNSPAAPNAVEWGVTRVNAPSVWALGYNGGGMVIGGLDSGIRWTHNALKPKYRGWNGVSADHNFNWHDAVHTGGGVCGPNTVAPCDDNGHGTHTAATTVGDDGSANQVGVAPGAKWIGCRNMDQGVGTPATYTECFQFMIAPTDLAGNNPNPALRPHVLNNSWTCPPSEGCASGTLEAIVNNTRAAGIFIAASAGNSGPACSSVTDPPAIYSGSFSVGAFDINNALASFSSRGPSIYYNPSLLKPNLSAPGVNVRSATSGSDTSYGNLSGTSMASPHVAGVVALLWSARPDLVRDIDATSTLLQTTANSGVTAPAQTCGGTTPPQIPNNSFGYGRVDALAAVNASTSTPTPTATPTATPTPTPVATPTRLANISTRLRVEKGDNVLIGGFIITGTQPKKVIVRAIGPSLNLITGLGDPIVELLDSTGKRLALNDNWRSDQEEEIIATKIPPESDFESAIVATLPAEGSAYTAIVTGLLDDMGLGVVEVYDLDNNVDSELANISTRGFVQTGDNVLIAGLIAIGPGTEKVLVRAIGPSLSLAGKLEDPTLELRDANGGVLRGNDNWRVGGQEQEIIETTIPPTNDFESAVVATLPAGGASYTAIVRGVNDTTGIAVVEVYALH